MRKDKGKTERPEVGIYPVESIFFQEWLAGNRCSNQIPISAVCNSRCLFCSNELNPFPLARGVFRDVEDIKLQLSLIGIHPDALRMSDSLPGRIAEGEALLHPKLFEILALIRRKFLINKLCFTTNGSMLDEAFVGELSRFRPIEINLSMHSTKPTLWARIFGKSEKDAGRAIASPALIRSQHLDLIGTIVPLPKICTWQDIEETYAYFIAQGAKSMTLYWPGYTVRTDKAARREIECSLEEFTEFAQRMQTRYAVPLSPLPDMQGPLKIPVEEIMSNTLRGNLKNLGGAYRRVLWMTSPAAYMRLSEMIKTTGAGMPNRHAVIAVKNKTYGGNIIVNGLLMVEDIVRTGQSALEKWPDTELILVSNNPFDAFNRDLQGTPAHRISEGLNRPVWLVDHEGHLDPLLDRPFRRLKERDESSGPV